MPLDHAPVTAELKRSIGRVGYTFHVKRSRQSYGQVLVIESEKNSPFFMDTWNEKSTQMHIFGH